jgi:hypothetical protein
LIFQSNALLSAMALREALRLDLIRPQVCRRLLREADYRLVAAYVYLMLTLSPSEESGEWTSQILDRVSVADTSDALYAIGLGAFAALLFHHPTPETAEGAKRILMATRNHLATFHRSESHQKSREKEPQLLYMFEHSGID